MNPFELYFRRYGYPKAFLNNEPPADLGMVVVIPAYNEPDILTTLHSLLACARPPCAIEVIVVLNYSESDTSQVKKTTHRQHELISQWAAEKSSEKFSFHTILESDIPHKQAGPGIARKIGMDEAVRRFMTLGNKKGIIASLDADCRVANNYLSAIVNHWKERPDANGVSIFFEHPLRGGDPPLVDTGITDYELHLRYYVNAQAYVGFPFAFQTVGSSFAVTANAYQKQGGMNKRKAGEDFYFLHKIIPLGGYHNLNTTTVFPSSRSSDRVPFGTGRTISQFLLSQKPISTYNFRTFIDLRCFLADYERFYKTTSEETENIMGGLPECIKQFLILQNFPVHLDKINSNSATVHSFKKSFFRWFDAFRLMKFVHHARDHFFPNEEVGSQAILLLREHGIEIDEATSNEELLILFRKMDRSWHLFYREN